MAKALTKTDAVAEGMQRLARVTGVLSIDAVQEIARGIEVAYLDGFISGVESHQACLDSIVAERQSKV